MTRSSSPAPPWWNWPSRPATTPAARCWTSWSWKPPLCCPRKRSCACRSSSAGLMRRDADRWPSTPAPRPEPGEPNWTRHATGYLSSEQPPPTAAFSDSWPPADAIPVALEHFYDAMAERGYHYGPIFRGVKAAWQRGHEVFAEAALPEQTDVTGFTLHPALFDVAMHAALVMSGQIGAATSEGVSVPFAFNRVAVHASGASAVRVRLTTPADGSLAMDVADPAGAPVLSLGSVISRPLPATLHSAARPQEAMFAVDWMPLPGHHGPPVEPHSIAGR